VPFPIVNVAVRHQSVGDQSVRDQSVGDQSVRDQSVRDQSVRDQSVRDQSVGEQSVRDQSVRDQSVPVTTAWRVLGLRMEERPAIWRAAANVLNKESRTADRRWSSSMGGCERC
jgi:hypothetical protein